MRKSLNRVAGDELGPGRSVYVSRGPDPRLGGLLARRYVGFRQAGAQSECWVEPPRPAVTLIVSLEGELRANGHVLPEAWVGGLSDTHDVVQCGGAYACLEFGSFGRRSTRARVDPSGCPPGAGALLALDLAAVRAAGAPAAAERALAHLTRPDAPNHFWVHVDADVLDDAVMPAVDYRQPGGLRPDELATILAAAMATGRVADVVVTIDNPVLDPAGTAGTALAGALARGLGGATSFARDLDGPL